MKVLIDECLDERLRLHLPGQDAFTARYAGLTSVRNGELLRRAADTGFEALLTADRSMRHQHNPATLPLSIVCLHPTPSNRFVYLLPLVPRLLEVLATLPPRTFADVP